jgi:hypothetical protein
MYILYRVTSLRLVFPFTVAVLVIVALRSLRSQVCGLVGILG